MKYFITILLLSSIVFIGILTANDNIADFEKNWHQWRGPLASGISPNGNPPVEWSEQKNVKWKTEIPGSGRSTPVIWDNQIFILTTIETDKKANVVESSESGNQGGRGPRGAGTEYIHKFVVLSIDRDSGKILWQKTVREDHPKDRIHELSSWASNSPVTDGRHVYAYFGSMGLYCLDIKGNLKWERDFGDMQKRMTFGEGSSPIIYKDKVIVLWDHEGDSFIIAVDKNTGKDIWKKDRDEITSWSTPFIIEHNGTTQLITSATNRIRSYNPDNGALRWECSGMTANVIPQPLHADDMVYLMSGFRGNALFAIDLSKAKGDITGTDAIVWQYNQDTPYTPSPILVDDKIYMLRGNKGYITCLNAKDGKVIYSAEKLEQVGDVFASLVAVNDRIYVTGKNGSFSVIKHGSQLEILAQNQLDDNFISSPAIIDDNIYLRGYKNLYCISEN